MHLARKYSDRRAIDATARHEDTAPMPWSLYPNVPDLRAHLLMSLQNAAGAQWRPDCALGMKFGMFKMFLAEITLVKDTCDKAIYTLPRSHNEI